MSLIFNALQRLGRSPDGLPRAPDNKKVRRHSQRLRDAFLSPPVILTAGGVIVVGAMLLFSGGRPLAVRTAATVPVVHAVERPAELAEPARPGPTVHADNEAVRPLPAAAVPGEQIQRHDDGTQGEPAVPVSETNSRIEFFPPEQHAIIASAKGHNSISAPHSDPEPPSSAIQSEALSGRLPGKGDAPPVPVPAGSPPGPDKPVQAAATESVRHSLSLREENNSDRSPRSAVMAQTKDEDYPSPDPDRRKRAARQLRTTQLVNRITGAIHSENHTQVVMLFGQLEKIVGPDHLFLMKLKAFWNIRRGHLDEARTLLRKVLSREPEDRESGMNMAVIDIRSGRYDAARRRLEKLHDRYPEDTNISVSLQQLVR